MAVADDLTCRELVELVTDYLEGALNADERARFEQHLAECEGCRHYLEQMRITILTAGRTTPETAPEPLRGALVAAYRTLRAG